MTTPAPVTISGAVEGPADEAVLRRLVQHVGATLGTVYGKQGKDRLQQQLNGYNQAARYRPWVVLIDLDRDGDCVPPLLTSWLPNPAPYLCFRIAVRAIEAWLIADRERIARFLSVSVNRVPTAPETLDSPKIELVNLARHSRRRAIREDMVPRPESGRQVGPAYTSRLIEFVEDARNGWRPDVAAAACDSLARSLRCIQRLVEAPER